MTQDISSKVLDFWQKGLTAKNRGLKEEAMKNFLGYYDMLKVFQNSFNLNISEEVLTRRIAEAKREITELLLDQDYLKITILPPEGIREIRGAMGLK